MTSEKNSILEKIKKIYFQVLPVSVFFYITLTTYFPRNCYKFVKTETIENNIKPKITKLEKLSKIKLRKKLIIDLKFHDTSLNWSRKNVTKLLLNPEGKIIGYKFCKIFYPNYFTRSQSNKIISKSKVLKPNEKLFLVIFKR